ncbi:MAG: LysR family transcriptional regulator [Caulobacteraceae bacterium]
MRQVLAIRQFGSFAKAAEALGMSQPSLSKSIARLEDQLKVRIFDRTSSGSELTPIGEAIVERVQRVIAETEDLVRDTALIAGGEAGRVRLGVSPSLSGEFLSHLLLRTAEAYPNLSLHIESGTRLLAPLAARELDIAFCGLAPETRDPRFVATGILDCFAVAVASPDHPLARLPRVELSDLAQHRLAGQPGAFRADRPFALPDLEAAAFYTTNNYEAAMPLVLAGRAALVASHFVVQRLIRSGELVQLAIDLDLAVSFVAVTTRAAHFSPILNRLTEIAQNLGRDLRAEWDLERATARAG